MLMKILTNYRIEDFLLELGSGLSNQIFAAKYVLYMPDKEQLIAQVEDVINKWNK